MQLKDKVAVVTGGASGLGRAVAELFLKSGAKAVILDLARDENAKNVAALGEHASGGKLCAVTRAARFPTLDASLRRAQSISASRSVVPTSTPAWVSSVVTCPRWWVWWLKKCTSNPKKGFSAAAPRMLW